jgi:REP element-mobilizing transposase RayT
MGRPHRVQIENGLYHVTIRGNRRGLVFLGEDDYLLFLRLLRRVVRRFGWEVHAYCLMPNHYHLLFTTPDPNLSAGMCLLNGHYARAFNDIHHLTGHVFERRFHAVLVKTEEHLIVLSAYIALNPVIARLVDRAEDYLWSSYGSTVTGKGELPFVSPDRLFRQFDADLHPPREAYRRYVERRHADVALV